jgi:uncharacterized protein
MHPDLETKYQQLLDYLRGLDQVAVACSGGVDSTLLAFAAVQALGVERVLILFGKSCLLTQNKQQQVRTLLRNELPGNAKIDTVELEPLKNSELARNEKNRCYLCKKQIYTRFLEHLEKTPVKVLLDGTNIDDLSDDRPGLQAVRELGILTPLVTCGFNKAEIRAVADALHLANANLPSDSCLATRLPPSQAITEEALEQVERFESFLTELGFSGCRVRPRGDMVIIEVQKGDIVQIAQPQQRAAIERYFAEHGCQKVLLDLKGRDL